MEELLVENDPMYSNVTCFDDENYVLQVLINTQYLQDNMIKNLRPLAYNYAITLNSMINDANFTNLLDSLGMTVNEVQELITWLNYNFNFNLVWTKNG